MCVRARACVCVCVCVFVCLCVCAQGVRLGWATLLYNYCVYVSQQDADVIKEDTRMQVSWTLMAHTHTHAHTHTQRLTYMYAYTG